jgi:hypothetical protein
MPGGQVNIFRDRFNSVAKGMLQSGDNELDVQHLREGRALFPSSPHPDTATAGLLSITY